jgi:hypothetical protein
MATLGSATIGVMGSGRRAIIIYCEHPDQVARFHTDVARITGIASVEIFLRNALARAPRRHT